MLESAFIDCIRDVSDLHDYQDEAVGWLHDRPFSALFIDVGMGKTVIIETLLDELFVNGYDDGPVLVIAPIRVATRVWMQENKLWRHLAYLNPTLIRVDDADERIISYGQLIYNLARSLGKTPKEATAARGRAETSRKNRILAELLKVDSRIHVINKEAVGWLVSNFVEVGPKRKVREIKRWPYKVVIVDESSVLGDHNNVIFKALQNVLHRVKRLHELTATPASQSYMRFFSQIFLLDHGKRLGRNITAYRDAYFSYNRYSRRWTLRPGAAEDIEKKISDICMVMRRKKNFITHTRPVRLPRGVMQQYRDFERDSILEIGDKVIDAINGAALSNKLLQFASGAVYDENRKYHTVHDEKIDELRQLADETLDNPVMVAYWYKSSLDRLRKAFPEAAIMDREGKIETDWNKRKFKLMFVHPRGVAHGMNLQFGGHHLALFDIFWPLDLFTQLIGRLDRQGQTHTVMVHLLSAVGTHDEVVSTNLEVLRNAEDGMFRRLQGLQRRIRDGGIH